MCGITGIINKGNSSIKFEDIKRMNDMIVHRGPDDEGFYFGENFAFGHRRLSILDLSKEGHQPMQYMDDRYVITYNGEVYNYLELKDELINYGYKFNSNTDTEVILASYDKWGKECLNKFNGMWAFAIYDKLQNIIFLSRDRFGVKPLYYYTDDNVFVFGSEIKAILEYLKKKVDIDDIFLNDYIAKSYRAYSKNTVFKDIYMFDFASYFEGKVESLFENFKQKKFWKINPNLSYEKFNINKAKKLSQEYYDILEDAVKIRLRADVKVGSALSGGLDSSSIVYLVNKILKEQQKEELQETFSSVYKSSAVKDCDESKYINILANKLGVHSNQIEPKECNVPKEHRKVIYMMENPPESTCMSGWYTFKLVASTDVKVTLDGQGADEQLAGYLPYLTNYISSLPFSELIKESIYCLKIPSSKIYVIKGFLVGLSINILGRKITDFLFRKIFKKEYSINLNQKLACDINENLITLIYYSDRVSMAHSIESRMPFMDYRVVEFLASVPSCYKIRNGWTKYLARLAFDKKLPDEITWRQDKMGWPIPENYWFRGNLKEWFIKNVKESRLVKKYDINIEDELSKDTNITKLIRFLNIAIFEKVFMRHIKV